MRSDQKKPAPKEAVVEKLKEVVADPTIIDKFNEGRHDEDKVLSDIDYVASFFGVSYRTIYRRLREAGITVAKIRKSLNDLNVEKTIDTYHLKDFNPIVYNIENKPQITVDDTHIIVISDIQFGALTSAHGKITDPFAYTRNYFDKLKKKVMEKFNDHLPEKLIVALAGDLVDGENIYIGQNVIPVHRQAMEVTDILYDFIAYVHSMIEDVTIVSVKGNHGNLSKYYMKESNWDNVVAEMLKSRIDIHKMHNSHQKVNVITTTDQYVQFKAGKWNLVMHHGNMVKGVFTRGTSAFNSRPIEQHMESMKLGKFKDMDAFIIGHWHRFHFGELLGMQYVVNGTCYESDFVRDVLMGIETMSFAYIVVGEEVPFETVHLLHMGDSNE